MALGIDRLFRRFTPSASMALLALAVTLPAAATPPAATPAASTAPPNPVAVEIVAADELMLHGTYWAAAQPGPGVLLLHQCNMDRWSWEPLAKAFAQAGTHVLAFDFRGFGESRGTGGDFKSDSEKLWPSFIDDVDRMVAFFRTLPDVNADRFGVMGASCGGSQALLLALRDPKVRALGFLSSSLPWIEAGDVVQFEMNRTRPILAIASEGDKETFDKTRGLFERSKDPMSKIVLYKGDLHGVPLFEHDPGLVDSIVRWFAATL